MISISTFAPGAPAKTSTSSHIGMTRVGRPSTLESRSPTSRPALAAGLSSPAPTTSAKPRSLTSRRPLRPDPIACARL
jgi:hypothetical protein